MLLMTGTFGISYWGWEIILGGIVAAMLLIVAGRRKSVGLLLVGCGLTMAGVIANRWNTTMLAFTQPLSTEPQLTLPAAVRYLPNAIEWASAIGIVSILTFLFSMGMHFLPAFRGISPSAAEPLMAAAPAGGD